MIRRSRSCMFNRQGVNQRKLQVPNKLRGDILKQLHDSRTSGHFGMAKTLGKVRERYFWPNWKKCEKRASRKGPMKTQRGPMRPSNVGALLERIAIDVLGPLPTYERVTSTS